MEPLYAALSFVAVALVLLQLGRYLLERGRAKRAQRRLMANLEPLRVADEATVGDVVQAYGIEITTQTPIYEVTGRVEGTRVRAGAISGYLFYVGGVEIAPRSVSALEDAGIALEDFLPGGDAAHDRIESTSVRADRLRGEGVLVDRFAGGDASLRHIEFCFADGDDPRRAACHVLAFDGRRVV